MGVGPISQPMMPQVTQQTKERAENAKAFIEKKYQKLKNEEKERKEGKFIKRMSTQCGAKHYFSLKLI